MQKKFLDDNENLISYISIGVKPLVSLVILSFNRPEFLHRTIASLKKWTTYPYELIICDDGSLEESNSEFLWKLYKARQISLLILNAGKNMGVGSGINKGFHASHGKYLIKLDSDLEFFPFWLEKVIAIMETFPEIGCLGLFKYHYPPCQWQDKLIRYEERDGIKIGVYEDQVGSTMCFPRGVYEKYGDLVEGSYAHGEDYIYKMKLKKAGYWIALPENDLVYNYGFGLNTTSLLWKGEEVKVSKKPLIFGSGKQ